MKSVRSRFLSEAIGFTKALEEVLTFERFGLVPLTQTDAMNNGGTPDGSIIVGLYVYPPDSSGQYRGYIVHNGRFHPYNIAGSSATQIWGINPAADFVGLYDDTDGHEHGFLQRWRADAPITIDVPSGPPFKATHRKKASPFSSWPPSL